MPSTDWLVPALASPLQLPIMLQQYVEHGGCLFKVYVLGDTYGEPACKLGQAVLCYHPIGPAWFAGACTV